MLFATTKTTQKKSKSLINRLFQVLIFKKEMKKSLNFIVLVVHRALLKTKKSILKITLICRFLSRKKVYLQKHITTKNSSSRDMHVVHWIKMEVSYYWESGKKQEKEDKWWAKVYKTKIYKINTIMKDSWKESKY